MARRQAERPARATLKRNGVQTHIVDLEACWQALLRCQAEDDQGRYDSQASLAAVAGTSRASVNAFFRGGPTSVVIGRLIIAALRLEFDQVAEALAIVSGEPIDPNHGTSRARYAQRREATRSAAASDRSGPSPTRRRRT